MKYTKLLFLLFFFPVMLYGQTVSLDFGRMKNETIFLNEDGFEADILYASNFIQIDYTFPFYKDFNGILGYSIIDPNIGVNHKNEVRDLLPESYGYGHILLGGISFKSLLKNNRLSILPQFLLGTTISIGGQEGHSSDLINHRLERLTWVGNGGFVDFFLNPKIRAKLKILNTFHLIGNIGYQYSFGKNYTVGYREKFIDDVLFRKTTFTTGTNFNYSLGVSICPSCL